MNETVSRVLNELKQFPLHFEFAYAEQNSRGRTSMSSPAGSCPSGNLSTSPAKGA